MPLTAVHSDAGIIDLTAIGVATAEVDHHASGADAGFDPELLPGLRWDSIYKARPRPPLSCRECSHGLHAKVSLQGMRFFAHDAHAPDCGLAGESLAHRLLKMELASAIRDAGWLAELEVPGDGWRADVLATSPDGSVRMAWEAQLAAATAEDLANRTARMAAEGVWVCWVTDRDRPFIGHVPSIRIGYVGGLEEEILSGEASHERQAAQVVLDGLGSFEPDWCQSRTACTIWAQHGYDGRDEGPCGGHGRWGRPQVALTLSVFVGHVVAGVVRVHEAREEQPSAWGRHRPGKLLWTTERHVLGEQDQIDASAVAASFEQRYAASENARHQDDQDHLAAIAALEARQDALTAPAVQLVCTEASGYVWVRDSSPDWAMGVPLFVHDMPQGVIAPVASRIKGAVRERLAALTVFVATPAERDRVARAAVPGQRIVLFEVEVELRTKPKMVNPKRRHQQQRRREFGDEASFPAVALATAVRPGRLLGSALWMTQRSRRNGAPNCEILGPACLVVSAFSATARRASSESSPS